MRYPAVLPFGSVIVFGNVIAAFWCDCLRCERKKDVDIVKIPDLTQRPLVDTESQLLHYYYCICYYIVIIIAS